MKTRYTKLVESMYEDDYCNTYYFKFKDLDNNTQACVMWYVTKRMENPFQIMTIEIEGGDADQITGLIEVYIYARAYGERFDIGGVNYIFEEYALNEGFDIEAE